MAVKKKQSLISFDAPASLIFSFASLVIFLLSREIMPSLLHVFSAPASQHSEFAFVWTNPLQYFRFLIHVLGNTSWSIFASDIAFILLLGPQLEKKFGSLVIVLMMAITACVSGILNAAFSSTLLMGGTGIAFMMILLSAFTSIDQAKIPLSFILAALLFLFREFYYAIDTGTLSNFLHLVGGLSGSALGLTASVPQTSRKTTARKMNARQSSASTRKPATKSSVPKAAMKKTAPSLKQTSQNNDSSWQDITTFKL